MQQNHRTFFKFSILGAFLLLVSLGLSAVGPAPTGDEIDQKISPFILKAFEKEKNLEPTGGVDLIAILKDQADLSGADRLATKKLKGSFVYQALTEQAQKSQTDLMEWLKLNQLKYQRFYIANMIAVKNVPQKLLHDFAARADVGRLVLDPRVKIETPKMEVKERSLIGSGIEANITSTRASKVWAEMGVKGAGIVIAGQDTGVQWDHPALKAQYLGYDAAAGTVDHRKSWHDAIATAIGTSSKNKCGYDLSAPCDDDQHGTHTMGTMLGDDGKGNQIGMAPEAKWMACRNMDAGTGRPTTYINCFEFFLAPYAQGEDPMTMGDPTAAPHVINNSWGCPISEGCEGSEMILVLKALKAAGIVVVVSAGNEGDPNNTGNPKCSTIESQPASISDLTFSVGAVNHRTNRITDFSSRGPSLFDQAQGPDISAPGDFIRSSVPGSSYEDGWSGTSMAGPHVAGLVALIWSAKPSLIGKVDETSDLIRNYAIQKKSSEKCGGILGSEIPNNTYGYGIIDAYESVKAALALP